jgi:diguanylate cyclase (GGDEF)-like protein
MGGPCNPRIRYPQCSRGTLVPRNREFTTTVKSAKRLRRPPDAPPQKRFPGEASWQWHVQLRIERIISPLRIGVLAITDVAWWLSSHPANSAPNVARLLIIAASVYAAADVIIIYRFAHVAAKRPWLSTVLDALFITSWIFATGGANSAFLGLAVVGAVSTPLRNPPVISLSMSAVYAVAVVMLAGISHWYDALYVLIVGWGLTIWTAVTYRDRRNSLRDDLTGSFSREYANFRLTDVYEQDAFPIAVAVIDLDGFKKINDTYGHPAGDAVLVQAVRAISAAIRQGDLLARSGGDEFLLILPRTNAQAANTVAERVRAGIELTRFRHRRDLPPVRLTASIGLAVAEDANTDRQTLINRADEWLYAAKESGRNRVSM